MKLKHLLTLALTVLTATVVRADVTVTVTAPSDAVCSVTQKPGNKHYAPFIVYSEVSQETADGGYRLERPIHVMFYKPCTSLTFITENPKVSVDGTCQLEWDIKPGDNQAAPAQFTSSDENIATVDADGKVTGVSEGKATITATSYKLYKEPVTANVDVTVFKHAGVEVVAVETTDTWSMTPNPADSYINVATAKAGELRIFAIAGQCVLSTGVNAGDNTVDVSGLANGYYIVSLNGQSKRLIIR